MIKESKSEIIGVRVTKKEKEVIKKLCIERYPNVSECIRDIIKKTFGLKD